MPIESTEGEREGYRSPQGGGSLVVSLEGNVVQTVTIGERVLTIGRLPQNGLVLSHGTISRYHAEVRMEGAVAILTDVGSSAGTVVDGQRILPNQPCRLEPGSVVQIGPFELLYKEPEYEAPIRVAFPQEATIPALAHPVPPAAARTVVPATLDLDDTLVEVPARARYPAPLPLNGRSEYLKHLPALYQENKFLARMLLIFEALWEPLERRQDHIEMYFDPRTCPASFLPWLAAWLDLSLDRHWPEERRRHLLAEAMELYRWRGTKYGLTRMLEVCTGLTPTITEDPRQPYVFRVSVRIPPGSTVRRDVIEELVRAHKPAHVGYSLEIST